MHLVYFDFPAILISYVSYLNPCFFYVFLNLFLLRRSPLVCVHYSLFSLPSSFYFSCIWALLLRSLFLLPSVFTLVSRSGTSCVISYLTCTRLLVGGSASPNGLSLSTCARGVPLQHTTRRLAGAHRECRRREGHRTCSSSHRKCGTRST